VRSTILSVVSGLCMFAPLAASAEPALPKSMDACSTFADEHERVVCYDKAVIALRGRSASTPDRSAPDKVVASAAVVAQPKPGADFGVERLKADRAAKPPPGPSTLTDRVTAIREVRPSLFSISLANGQVWRQMESTSYLPLKVGDPIRITKSQLGAYQMALDKEGRQGTIRVVRVE
jgi:hypothetical protein